MAGTGLKCCIFPHLQYPNELMIKPHSLIQHVQWDFSDAIPGHWYSDLLRLEVFVRRCVSLFRFNAKPALGQRPVFSEKVI